MSRRLGSMGRSVVRTLEAHVIHGHSSAGSVDAGLLDYVEFFETLASVNPQTLRFPVGPDTVAIAEIVERSGLLCFQFVSGNATELPLIYDSSTASVTEVDPGDGRLVVRSAWVLVDPESRILVLERRRPGVPTFQIERFLSQVGRELLGVQGLVISINPVPSASFTEEIEAFTRVREVSITLRRPNHSWTATASGMLGELAESNAAQVQLQLNADRGQSLSKTRGVVDELKQLVRHPISALKNAVVKGNTPSFDGEKTVSLQKHIVKGTARLDSSDGPIAQLDELSVVASTLVYEVRGSEAADEAEDGI